MAHGVSGEGRWGMPDFNFCVVLNWEVWGHLAFALVFAFGVLEIGSIRATMIYFLDCFGEVR